MKETIATTGKIIKIDLKTRQHNIFQIAAHERLLHLGGRGLGLKYYFHLGCPGIDPLGEENPLILRMEGFLGSNAPCTGRYEAVTKSPLTATLVRSSCRRPSGMALKTAGYEG
jgi:aldehyde:ferredoxin oxidoreductase